MYGFAHIEIPTTDSQKSKVFYGKLFGWKMAEDMPNYVMFTTGENQSGGLTQDSKPSENGVILYIEVEDITKKLSEIESAGGRKVKEKTAISPEFGFYGLFTDPSGNIMGLWSKT
ncbi:MAG: VOC family protein [candidate division WOR-3 bacterium]|nr:MAG: VOC family protein [candidate division WOR-3 bacterium]